MDVKIGEVGRGSIVFNPEAVEWLSKFLVEACRQSVHSQLWTKLRESNKWLLVEARQNDRGRFIVISSLQGKQNDALIFIPFGKEGSGWKRFYCFLRVKVPAKVANLRSSKIHENLWNNPPSLHP